MTSLRGILFDFDGTLADTMEGHYLAWKAALGEHGISIEASDYYPLEGTGLHEVARIFTKGLRWTEAAVDELVLKKRNTLSTGGQLLSILEWSPSFPN